MITIYAPDTTDFGGNGLGQLFPTECTIHEAAGGLYELSMEHPIDKTLRWAQLSVGCFLKVDAPKRESPMYEIEAYEATEETSVTVTRQLYAVKTNGGRLRLRQQPNTNSTILGLYYPGTQVVKLADAPGGWFQVSIRNGGAVGYMYSHWLTDAGTITETITSTRPVTREGVTVQPSRAQLFRVTSVEPDTSTGLVTVSALHVFYDMRGNLIDDDYKPAGETVRSVMDAMQAKLLSPSPFSFHAPNFPDNVKITGDYAYKNPIEAMLDPDEGIAAQAQAILVRDNYDVYLLPNQTRDMGVTIRRGKNLVGVSVKTDGTDIVTRIIPVGKNANGDDLLITDGDGAAGKYIDSAHIGDYSIVYAKRIDYDVKVVSKDADGETTFPNDDAARAKLKQLAQADFSKNGIDLPQYGMEVDFVLLQYAEGYEQYASLQSVHLYDTVTVIDELIGLRAKVRVTEYTWNVLTQQYESITLGDIMGAKQMVYSYNLPTGGISGTKIAPGSADGKIIRSASLQYAQIATAAIDRLNAESITALTAYIGSLTAESITTDHLVAAMANVLNLTVGNIRAAEKITTEALAAATANLTEVIARYGYFDNDTVRHLVSETLHITDAAVAERIMIENLAVAYAQVVSATIGELCIRASDGGYYLLDVDTDHGTVTATPTQVSDAERAAGHTSGGKTILDTDITAENLNAANIFATYALVNQIDAARIDVDQLFAREAFIQRLNTAWITSDSALTIISRLNGAESAAEGAQAAISDMDHQLKLWFKFDSDRGLVVQKMDENGNPASIWYTVTDEVGYHIGRTDLRDYVFSAYRDRVWVQNLEIGDIVVKPSGKGGWAWSGR